MIKKILPVLILSSSFYTPNAFAEKANALEDSSLESMLDVEVVTASKKAQKSSLAPATIHVITENQIKNRGYRNLAQLLEDIPEIEVQKKSVTETNNIISFRGIAGNEKFVILMDGFRINSADGTPHAVTENYSLANAKKVEVILGPSSALYGADAFGGIINIITKEGKDVDGAKIVGSFGQFTTTDNSFVFGKKLSDNLSFVLSGNGYFSKEPNFSEIYTKEFDWYNNKYKNTGEMRLSPFAPDTIVKTDPIKPYDTPTLAYSFNGKVNFDNFEIGFFKNQETHNSSVGLKPDFNIYQGDALYRTNVDSVYAKHNFLSNDKKWGLQTSISRNGFELSPDSKFVNTFTAYKEGYKYASGASIKIEEQANYDFSDNFSVIGGANFENVNSLPKTGDLPKPYNKENVMANQGEYYLGTNIKDKNGKDLSIAQDFYNLNYNNIGSYLQLQYNPFNTLGLTLGTRFDYNTRYGSSLNPRLGLVFNPVKPLTFKLLYGEAFLAPSPYKAYQHYGSFIPEKDKDSGDITGLVGPFWHLPNPDLQPEKLRSIEGSLSYYLTDNVFVSLNGYYNNISNLIVVEVKPNQTFKGVKVDAAERPINKGTSNTFGGTIKTDALFKIGDASINPFIAYSLSNGDVAGGVLPFSAQHTVKSGIEFNYKNFSLTPRVTFRSMSYHPTLKDDKGVNLGNEPYTLINLYAKYNNLFNSDKYNASLFLDASNLLNAKYYNIPLADAEGFAGSPQDPLRVLGGVSLEF